jgi:hypothetical protein
MVILRGGLEKGDLPAQMRVAVSLTETMCTFALQRRNMSRVTTDSVTISEDLAYPKHPFSADLTSTLSSLPEGFCDLALDSHLSVQVIQLLHRLNEMIRQGPESLTDIIMLDLMRISISPTARSLEKAIATLSLVFGILFGTKSDWKSRARVQSATQELLPSLTKSLFEEFRGMAGLDFVVWSVFLITTLQAESDSVPIKVESGGHEATEKESVNRILSRLIFEAGDLTEADMRRMVERYFWHNILDMRLSKMWRKMQALISGN